MQSKNIADSNKFHRIRVNSPIPFSLKPKPLRRITSFTINSTGESNPYMSFFWKIIFTRNQLQHVK
uniref:Uncharacterized protein n=1 Tax=Rhizophora mucronata TaxID=61149 RepID=A0A2P2QZX0_RHIMU